jgi:hypothetical protein
MTIIMSHPFTKMQSVNYQNVISCPIAHSDGMACPVLLLEFIEWMLDKYLWFLSNKNIKCECKEDSDLKKGEVNWQKSWVLIQRQCEYKENRLL